MVKVIAVDITNEADEITINHQLPSNTVDRRAIEITADYQNPPRIADCRVSTEGDNNHVSSWTHGNKLNTETPKYKITQRPKRAKSQMRDGQKKYSSTKLHNCTKPSGREITRARHHPTLTEPKTTKIDLAGVPTFSARFRAEKSTHSLANAHYQPWPIEYHLSLPSSLFLSWALSTPLALCHGNKWDFRTKLPGVASPKETPTLCTNSRVLLDNPLTQEKRSHLSTSSKSPTSNLHSNSADCRINHCETKILFLSQDVSSEGRFLRAFSLAFKEFLCMISCCFTSAILPGNRTIKRMINSTVPASHVGRSPKERLHQPMPEALQGITKK